MKVVGVIPSRYKSSRFPGKPLADLHGKPMIWWVYQQVSKVRNFDEVYVATDNQEIYDVCTGYGFKVLMTSEKHTNPTERTHEVSDLIPADIYVFIGGDEPLIEAQAIEKVVETAKNTPEFFVANAMTTIKTGPEVIDFTNIKMIANEAGDGLYTSRSPLPYPKGSLEFDYKKFVGICAFTKKALDFFVTTPQSMLEKVEECDLIRYIEHHKNVKFVDVDCRTVSVDTPKDLEMVKDLMVAEGIVG